jgi:PhzF family phenazine biosynthesis protein
MPKFQFHQVDVFTTQPLKGNPLAVVINADSLTDPQMQAFANWTNLSETTFLLKPTNRLADYRVRIFTPSTELPFAGHPTLGSCHVWLTAGGRPKEAEIIQECPAGLIRIRRDETRLAFAAPPLIRSGKVDAKTLAKIARILRIPPAAILHSSWADNGPGWVAVMLASRDELLALTPDFAAMSGLNIGVVAPVPAGAETQFEVRAFVPELGIPEDPVTGSLNAALAQWFFSANLAPAKSYIVSQGSVLGRAGRIHITQSGPDIWIGGNTLTCITGTLNL